MKYNHTKWIVLLMSIPVVFYNLVCNNRLFIYSTTARKVRSDRAWSEFLTQCDCKEFQSKDANGHRHFTFVLILLLSLLYKSSITTWTGERKKKWGWRKITEEMEFLSSVRGFIKSLLKDLESHRNNSLDSSESALNVAVVWTVMPSLAVAFELWWVGDCPCTTPCS